MATISFENVGKVYQNGTRAVENLSLDVGDGEFVVLVGPSGCGKTTALRMVAGLEDATEGLIRIGGEVVNDRSPRDRDVAMVFQNYALYPHMTVADNIGFSLKLHKVPKEEIRSRVKSAAGVLGLTEQLRRKPIQLSGGQRQRVAMGRAIVREPAAFLMDEPLSNLDAKLRVQMRAEVLRIHRHLGVATLYVTHDQTEAMTMGDRVAVLRAGHLQQYDAPQVLYDSPANVFVAGFIGSPAMNLYEGAVSDDGARLILGAQQLTVPQESAAGRELRSRTGRKVTVGIRPEHLKEVDPDRPPSPDSVLRGEVELVEALGSEKVVHIRVDVPRVTVEEPVTDPSEDLARLQEGDIGRTAATECVAKTAPGSQLRAGDQAVFAVDIEKLHLFDPDSGEALLGR